MSEYTPQDLLDNLNYLDETKKQIKQAIVDKGQPISDTDSFRSYVDKIDKISTLAEETADATATAEDILKGKTAYNAEGKIEGTLIPTEDLQEQLDAQDAIIQQLQEELSNKSSYDCNYYNARLVPTNDTITTYITKISPQLDTSNVTTMASMFYGCTNLTTIPLLNTINVTNMSNMFNGCTNLTTIPLLNTINVTNMSYMFNNCTNLTTIPLLNTSNVINMSTMFSACSKLTTIPLLNTSNVTGMSGMFLNCSSLMTIPLLDTSKVTGMSSMFGSCSSLTTIPLLDTSNVTDMRYMFQYCSNLTTIPLLNTSNVTDMSSMFSYNDKLTEIPLLDTSNVISMSNMFFYCDILTTIPLLDTSNVTNMSRMFAYCPNLSDESLNNILAMCTNAVKVTNKTLSQIGLTRDQATKCTALSNYSAFTAAGWTTGY